MTQRRKFRKDFKRFASNLALNKVTEDGEYNPEDTITMDVPLFIRVLEYTREDIKDDATLHEMVDRILSMSTNNEVLTMEQYEEIVKDPLVNERLVQLSRITR